MLLKKTAALLAHLVQFPTDATKLVKLWTSIRSPGPPQRHGEAKRHEGSLEVGHLFLLFICRCILRRNLAEMRKRAIHTLQLDNRKQDVGGSSKPGVGEGFTAGCRFEEDTERDALLQSIFGPEGRWLVKFHAAAE